MARPSHERVTAETVWRNVARAENRSQLRRNEANSSCPNWNSRAHFRVAFIAHHFSFRSTLPSFHFHSLHILRIALADHISILFLESFTVILPLPLIPVSSVAISTRNSAAVGNRIANSRYVGKGMKCIVWPSQGIGGFRRCVCLLQRCRFTMRILL